MPDLLLHVELRLTNGQCRLWVIRVISGERERLPLFTQLRTYRCIAANVAQGR